MEQGDTVGPLRGGSPLRPSLALRKLEKTPLGTSSRTLDKPESFDILDARHSVKTISRQVSTPQTPQTLQTLRTPWRLGWKHSSVRPLPPDPNQTQNPLNNYTSAADAGLATLDMRHAEAHHRPLETCWTLQGPVKGL